MPGAFLSHGWLPAVLPAHARSFRVHDAALAYTLEGAGAALVPHGADVEIGALDEISGDAPTVIVSLNPNIVDSRARVRQVIGRVAASVEVRLRAARARSALARRGYRYVQTVPWDRDQPIHLAGEPALPGEKMAERFPRRVLVLASRERPAPTILQQALLEAGQRAGVRLEAVRPIVSSAALIVLTSGYVLRVAIGPATGLIRMQADALQALAGANPVGAISTRVPDLLGTAHAGLARWSLERRLRGEHPSAAPKGAVDADCLEFLLALYGTRPPRLDRRTRPAGRQAEFVTGYLPTAIGAAVRELAQEIDEEVGALRTGFWHGDFWMRNLLVENDRLIGVIDWAQGGPHGLPLLDLLNLEMIETLNPSIYEWGPTIVEYLLPRVARGPSDRSREYLRRAGLDISARQHRALLAAYWLERVSHQLGVYLDRGRDELWVQRNVVHVATALAGPASTGAAPPRPRVRIEKVAS